MGNLWSTNKKKSSEDTPRRIYVGEVPEIDETSEKNWNGRKTTRDSLSHSMKRPEVTEPPLTKTVIRANSTHSQRQRKNWNSKSGRGASMRSVSKAQNQYRSSGFCDNYIKTSRYTILTFIPKNLLEQFRRFVNFYFLIVTALQYMIDSPQSPASSTAGFLFVICVTAIKQGYEDWVRHKADDSVNNRKVDIITNGRLQSTKSKHLKVGDIVRLEIDDPVPADILVLSSSDEFHRCQVTTANLDGESNLKMRYCPPGLPKLKNPSDFYHLNAVMECEQANTNLYSFNGNLLILQAQVVYPGDSVTSKTSKENGVSTSESLSKRLGKALKDSIRSRLSTKFADDDDDELPSGGSKFLQIPITMENMLLRGTKLKNTDYIYGLVVYTGVDTRLAQNSKEINAKFPTADRSINSFLLVVMGFLVLMVTLYTSLHFVWLRSDVLEAAWYLPANSINVLYTVETAFAYLVLFYYIVPLSLYVTIELQTFFGSMYFVWDNEMRCPVTGTPALCNTSDLNEELGQIEYLFSDKTGTLTENIMQFRHCSINGIRYMYNKESETLFPQNQFTPVELQDSENSDVRNFFKTLALCHTVQVITQEQLKKRISGSRRKQQVKRESSPETNSITPSDHLEFQASSPDELALLESCAELHVRFLGDQNEILTLSVCGKIEKFKRHYVLEFDADRKCMSVILENDDGEIWLLTKGAESTILPNGVAGSIEKSNQHVDEFAQLGLRTLAVAKKQLTREELDKFTKKLNKTRRLVKDREEKMRELYKSIETNLYILGATGVEDQLQHGVQDTLIALSRAGIRIWVLTGDKVETAVNVAIACGLLLPSSVQMKITNFKSGHDLKEHLLNVEVSGEVDDNTTFIIDGESLAIAFDVCAGLLCSVLMKAGRVVCCRMAPLQKAQVVSMVKSTPKKPITAAVGDGANDVAMIQEAHIGLGIFGKEGRQAARSADFAVARFSFLKKAILVHGHWYYVRLATLILYFFYKNVVLIFPPAYSAFYSAFSTQSLFDAIFMTFYNILFTSAPIFAFALQDQPVPAKTLLANPHLYKDISKNRLLTWKPFSIWIIRAVYHSLIVYFFPLCSLQGLDNISDWSSLGIFMIVGVITLVNFMLLTHTKYITGWILFAYSFSCITFFGTTTAYTETDMRPTIDSGELRHTFFMVLFEPVFWLNMVILMALVLVPDILLKYYETKKQGAIATKQTAEYFRPIISPR